MKNNELKISILCHYGHFFSHFYMLAFPTLVLFIQKDYNIEFENALTLGFPMYLIYGIAALPIGLISDITKAKYLLIVFLLGMGISSIFCSYSNNPYELQYSLAAVGLFAAIYHPVGIALLSKTNSNRGKALGNNGVFGNLGIATAPFITGFLSYYYDWQTTFYILGLPSLLYGIILFFLKIDEKSIHKDDAKTFKATSKEFGYSLLILLLGMLFLGLTYRGTVVSSPEYLKQNASFFYNFLLNNFAFVDKELLQNYSASILTSTIYLFGILGQLIGGFISSKYDLKKAYLTFNIITLPLMFSISILHNEWLIIVFALYLTFSLGFQPIENSLLSKITPPHMRATLFGFKFIGVFGMGSFSIMLVNYFKGQGHVEKVYQVQALFIFIVVIGISIFTYLFRDKKIKN